MLRFFRRYRFETPELEAEFQVHMDAFVCRTFSLCCIFLLLLFVVILAVTSALFPRCTAVMGLPSFLVLAIIFVLLLMIHCVPSSKLHIHTLLPLTCTTIIGLIAWSIHLLMAQSMQNVLDLSLVRTLALLRGQTEAQAELMDFVRDELSRKCWFLAMLVMFINIDVLRLTGAASSALFVHLMPVVVIIVTTYCSDQISNRSIDTLSVAAVCFAYSVISSVHMLMTFRDRFLFDYQLRQRMAKEAEMMQIAKNVEVAQRQASQKADTMLNHILKNIMAEAHGCIDLFFCHRDGSEADEHLRRAQESLERGMRWCKKRQVMVQVNSGDYTPLLAPTSLRKLVDGMVYGRDIVVDIPDLTVYLDSLLCELVLDNAISNAFRHGDTTLGPISLVVNATHTGKEHSMEVTFTLTNYVPDDHPPVTSEMVRQLAVGHDICGLANAPALSDHLGLRHMFLAAAAHHMTTSLEQVGNLVVFTASLEAERDVVGCGDSGAEAPGPPPLPCAAASFPPGLRILCLDDSEIARRVLLHGLTGRAPQTVSQVFGATEDEVAAFEAAALSGADIVVLDQHLDYHHVTIYGTDIAQHLRQSGFTGFICVRSANATDEDEAVYLESGADCMIGKDIPLGDMVETLQLAYEQHNCAQRTRSTEATQMAQGDVVTPRFGSMSFLSTPDT